MTIFPDKIDDQRGDFFLSVQNHRALAVPWISPSSTGPIAVEGDCEDIIIPYDVSFMDDSGYPKTYWFGQIEGVFDT